MKKYLFIGALFITTAQQAQNLTTEQFLKDSAIIVAPKMIRPQVRFDNRFTMYEGQSLSINGFDAGVLLKDKLRVTLGYYKLDEDLNAFKETIDSVDVGRLIKIEYGSLNTEVIYMDRRYFALGMPLEIGVGQSELKYKNFTSGAITKIESGLLAIAHFGLSGTFKPIRWIGLKALVGYRKTIYNQQKEFKFDGLFTSLGVNFDFREIIQDIKMMRLKKKYRRGNRISNAVDIITD